jgi:hypothetical protein
MKREYFSSFKQDQRTHDPRSGRCVALVDARFLIWLAQQSHPTAAGEMVNRHGLVNLLTQSMAQAGLDVDVVRVYWYTDRGDGLFIDDQIVRWVQTHDVDGGASMLRALGQDLAQLGQSQAFDHVLIATDDERFLSDIDAAQLRGLSVHVLADESARNMPQMMKSDPGWGRVLAQADRRVVVNAQQLSEMLQGKLPHSAVTPPQTPAHVPAESLEEVRQTITEVITAWWVEEPEDLREDLLDALQISRGVPQEVDRQLLLRMRQRLTRALSLNEKKLLREVLRNVVMGPAAAASGGESSAVPGALTGLPLDAEDRDL